MSTLACSAGCFLSCTVTVMMCYCKTGPCDQITSKITRVTYHRHANTAKGYATGARSLVIAYMFVCWGLNLSTCRCNCMHKLCITLLHRNVVVRTMYRPAGNGKASY